MAHKRLTARRASARALFAFLFLTSGCAGSVLCVSRGSVWGGDLFFWGGRFGRRFGRRGAAFGAPCRAAVFLQLAEQEFAEGLHQVGVQRLAVAESLLAQPVARQIGEEIMIEDNGKLHQQFAIQGLATENAVDVGALAVELHREPVDGALVRLRVEDLFYAFADVHHDALP